MDIMTLTVRLFNVSISASILAFAVILLRLIFKKAPKSLTVLLWALVAIRLICPFTLESKMSLIPSAEVIPAEILSVDPTKENTYNFDVITNPLYSNRVDSSVEINNLNSFTFDVIDLSFLWLIGFSFMLLYAFLSYFRLRLKVKAATPLKDNILICDEVKNPFILGIFRPKIYVPSDMDKDTIELVLAHEKAHLKRKDHLWKPLGFVLLSVYWFNPVLWLSYVLLCRDIELACDERVIRHMENKDKKAYSEALLCCSMPQRMISACPVAFGEVGVKQRIKSVINYKKPAFWLIVVTIIASIVVAICFMTNPKEQNGGLDSLINGVDKISEPYFRMSNIVFDARSYTVYEGGSTTDNYFEAQIEDMNGYGEVSQLLNFVSLGKLNKGAVDPTVEPEFSGAIKIERNNEEAITVLFHDSFQKMYMYKGNENYSLRSDDYAVLNVEFVRDFFEEKPYKSSALIWEYDLLSSAYGHASINIFIDERYTLDGEVNAEGVIEYIKDEEKGLEGISWRPDVEESKDSYKIEIPVIRNNVADLFTFTMNKVGKRGLASYYTLRPEELVVSTFPNGYEYVLGRAEYSRDSVSWHYRPMLSHTAHYFVTFLLDREYEIESVEATSGKATVENRFYKDDSEKCVKWTPDEDTEKSTISITALKNGKKTKIKIKVSLLQEKTQEGGKLYIIRPEKLKLYEEAMATYILR